MSLGLSLGFRGFGFGGFRGLGFRVSGLRGLKVEFPIIRVFSFHIPTCTRITVMPPKFTEIAHALAYFVETS